MGKIIRNARVVLRGAAPNKAVSPSGIHFEWLNRTKSEIHENVT